METSEYLTIVAIAVSMVLSALGLFFGIMLRVCVPERFVLAMIAAGWCLRNKIIYTKPNVLPSSAKSRFTTGFETVFWFTKQKDGYYFETQYEPMVSQSRFDMAKRKEAPIFGGRI